MAYTPPALTDPVVLSPGYTPPALTDPVVLGATVTVVVGTLAVTIPPPTLPNPIFTARQRPNLGANSWYVERLYRPAPPDFAAFIEKVQPASLAATIPPPSLPVVFRARERINTATVAVTIPPPTLSVSWSARVENIQPAAVAVTIPPPMLSATFAASITLDIALPDADGTGLRIESQPAAKTATGLTMPQQQMQPARRGTGIAEQSAAPIQVGAELLAAHGWRVRNGVGLSQAHGLPRWSGAGIDHAEAIRVRNGVGLPQAHGLPLDAGARVPHTDTIRTRNRLAMGQQAALPTALHLTIGQHQAQVTANRLSVRWQQAQWPDPGRWWPRYIVPPLSASVVLIPGYTPRPLTCSILLSWNNVAQPPCGGEPPPGPMVVPVREVYVVLNTFSLVRADTAEPVIAIDFDAAIDADSWTWTWSATVPGSQMDLVRSPALGEFVELIATLNGTAIRCVVERLGRSRQFGKSAIKISGRGRAAALADPSSPAMTVSNTEIRTAQQLIDDALTDNGIPLGWTVDWQLEDWPVAAGAWNYTGTAIGAALRVAEAGGGYVQADETAQTLHILPYYPRAPWDWAAATPDLVLPEDVCTTEDVEWSDKAPYNAVWIVGGELGGRRDKVQRAGSAADRQAPTVVDPLATDVIMTRQRGLRVLADTGRQALIGITLPVLAETGIIRPGTLIEYHEQGETHIGLSRAISLRWAFPTCRQTIKVETHELEPV